MFNRVDADRSRAMIVCKGLPTVREHVLNPFAACSNSGDERADCEAPNQQAAPAGKRKASEQPSGLLAKVYSPPFSFCMESFSAENHTYFLIHFC